MKTTRSQKCPEGKAWTTTTARDPGAHREDLHDVIGCGAHRVYILLTQHAHQAHAVRLQDPLLQGLELPILCDDDLLLVVSLWQVHVHLARDRASSGWVGGGGRKEAGVDGQWEWPADLADLLYALQGHVRQHVGLDAAQEDVIVHLVHHLFLLWQKRVRPLRILWLPLASPQTIA